MANDKIIHGGLVIKGSLATDDTLPILTIDTDGTIKKRAAIDLSTLLGGSLAQYNVLVGDSGGAAAAVDTNSVGDILVDETNGLNIKSGVIVNADINNSAAIAYSKLSLTGSIVNADVASGAAIVYSKLNLTGSIVNADIASGAAITRTKLAAGTAYRILANNGSGVISENAAITASRAVVSDTNGQLVAQADGTTAAQVGYLSDTTGLIQNQLDNLLATKPVNALVKSPTSGEDGFAITWDNGAGEWNLTDPVIQGIPVGGSSRQFLGKNSGTNYDADWLSPILTDIIDVSAVAADLNLLDGAQAAGLTSTHLQRLIGVNANVQTQIDSKQSRTLAQNAIWVGNSSNLAAALAAGTEGYVLKITSGVPTWAAESAGSPPGSDTEVVFNDGGSFGTDADLTYNKTTNTLTLANLGTTTTIGSAYIYRVGGTDVAVADGGTNISSYTVGDILYASGATTLSKLAAGTSSYVLTSNGAGMAPSWQASPSGFADPMTTRGDIIYRDASNTTNRLPVGSAGYVLTSDGTDVAWAAASGGVSGLTTNRVPYATSSTTLGDDSNLTWDNTNKALTIGSARFFAPSISNLFIGNGAGNFTMSGAAENIGIGGGVLAGLTTGDNNIVVGGNGSGANITSGNANTVFGYNALLTNSTGANNVAIGQGTLELATNNNNVALGTNAGTVISTGTSNTLLGHNAGSAITSGSGNVVIGADVGAVTITGNSQLNIQNAIYGVNNSGAGTTLSTGNIGLYTQVPTARFHLPAGTATAGTAPLKLTSGTALTSEEDGALEYHSSHLYFTIGSTRYQLDQQGGALGDGDYGDIVVSGSGTAINLDSTITKTATTGTGVAFTTSTLTSGTLVSFSATGTAAASNTKKVVSVTSSGANATASQTVTAFSSVISNTGTGADNVAGYFEATGGATNTAVLIRGGSTSSHKAFRMIDSGGTEKFYIRGDGQLFSSNTVTTAGTSAIYAQASVGGDLPIYYAALNSSAAAATGGYRAANNMSHSFDFYITSTNFTTIPSYGLIKGSASVGGLSIQPGSAGVVISNSAAALTTDAILDLQSTTKAFIPPRMTTTQRDAIGTPSAGMVIYNTTTGVLNFHNGSAWGAV